MYDITVIYKLCNLIFVNILAKFTMLIYNSSFLKTNQNIFPVVIRSAS